MNGRVVVAPTPGRAAPDPRAAPGARGPRRLSPYARHRLWALLAVVVVGTPAFVVGGLHWEGHVTVDDAVARFRALGPGGAEAVPGLPEPGVYRYQTSGGEHVSFLDYTRAYPDPTVRIVSRHGCGVREQQWFLEQHLEYYDRCGSELVAYGTDIAYWWTHGTQDFECTGGSFDGAGLVVGERVEWDCADEDTRAHQITEYLGDEEVVLGDGQRLPARHLRWSTVFSGATEGGAVVEDWFHPETGLVLRETRVIGLEVGTLVGGVDYVDESEYRLLSLTPER